MSERININTGNAFKHAKRIVRAADSYVVNSSAGVSTGRTTLTALRNGNDSFIGSQQVLTQLAEVSRTLGENISTCNTTFIDLDANMIGN